MIRQHAAFPHRHTKFSAAASTSGHARADLSDSPSLAKSISRTNHHNPAAITPITTIRIASVRRRFMSPPVGPLDGAAARTSSSTAVPGLPAETVVAKPAGSLHRAMAWLGPDFGLVAGFTAALMVLVAAYGGSYKWKEGPIVISAGIAAALVVARLIWGAPALVRNR